MKVTFVGGPLNGKTRDDIRYDGARGLAIHQPLMHAGGVITTLMYEPFALGVTDHAYYKYVGEQVSAPYGYKPNRGTMEVINRPKNQRQMLCFLAELKALREKWGVEIEPSSGYEIDYDPMWKIGMVTADLDATRIPLDRGEYGEWLDED